jgi:putative FmdB family regulatory protein
MPMYEYTCVKCEHEFEALVFAGDEPECPACHGKKLERRLSVPARPIESAPLATSCGVGPPCGAPGCRRVPR